MNLELFDATRAFIKEQLELLANPCVACSFGKDSMVMLHLILEHKPDIPVVYIEQFPDEGKHAFARKIADKWKLNMRGASPAWRTVYGKPQHVEIVTGYPIGPNAYLAIPSEPMAELEEATAMCGVDILNETLTGGEYPSYDGVFIGHRNDDRDVVLGDIPLSNNQSVMGSDKFKYIYPLKDWTSADIWNYHRRYEVPANEQRYGQKNHNANNDVWNLCTRCLSGSGTVRCPKEQDEIPAFGGMVDWEGVTADIRSNVINLEGR
jgi:3'-phosphoadenosine 5'-phosphosulfate sulfotransferase (PAPS reductase)/FAD synthetase